MAALCTITWLSQVDTGIAPLNLAIASSMNDPTGAGSEETPTDVLLWHHKSEPDGSSGNCSYFYIFFNIQYIYS